MCGAMMIEEVLLLLVVVHIRVYVFPLCVYVSVYERESANLIFGERKNKRV